MTDYPFAEAILNQTEGGLLIIFDYYPDAKGCENNSSKTFKRRAEEKTASATLKPFDDGTWGCADWGAWDKPKNAISICMFEDNLSYTEACVKLAKLYNVQYEGKTHASKPGYKSRLRVETDKVGDYKYIYRDTIPQHELDVIGPKVTNEVAKRFHLKSVISYTFVTEKEVITLESTDDYPIFAYDFGGWVKRYCPKDEKKSRRFRYSGGRPKDYVFGLDDVTSAFIKHKKEAEKSLNSDNPFEDIDFKLDKIVVCSGDRDAINMASFGYYVVWLNSETANLDWDTYTKLRDMANNVYNLPDIDRTGVSQGVELALQYLDLKTIWLPDYLLKTKDWRGNPRKDFLDFVNLKFDKTNPEGFTKRLKKLLDNALPMKFWDEVPDDKGMKYFYNIVHAEHFLKHQGFYRMETPFEKDEYCYIQVEGNIVKRTTPNKIENFVNNFLEARQMPIPLRNMVKKTPYLKEAMLSKLPVLEIDFKDCDAYSQYWFFKNHVIHINKDDIKVLPQGTADKMVMEEKVIDFPLKLGNRIFEDAFNEAPFKIFKDASGNDDIDILDKSNPFLNYLINISRIHWRKELETSFKGKHENLQDAYFKKHQFDIAGQNLDEDEILEQKQHLINKIYAIGYLLHKYKNKSKAWFVFGMDNKLSDIGESHGGSGKSLMYDYLQTIMKNQFFIPGRSKKAVDSEFLFDGVSKDTDYIFIDDMNQYFPFQQFFSEITGKMKVNPKGTSGYTIDFSDSPKLCGTSNFVPLSLDPSSTRRILFTVNSDYYHENKDNEYAQTRRVSDDFGGRNLFDDFTEDEYLRFYRFCAYAVKFHLSADKKIEPPMDNVNKRNLMAEMGDSFRNWSEVYLTHENGKLDAYIMRREAWESYKAVGKKSPNSFKKAIEAFCKYKGYFLNPKKVEKNPDGRIIQKIDGKAEEMFYIATKVDFDVTDEEIVPNTPINNQKTETDGSEKGLFD